MRSKFKIINREFIPRIQAKCKPVSLDKIEIHGY